MNCIRVLTIITALAMMIVGDVGAQSARQRVVSATIHYDPANGNDANDGSLGNAVRTLQRALNIAAYRFDIDSTDATWTAMPNFGARLGITIQMAPTSEASAERLTQPVFVDGTGSSGPITIRGDPNNPAAYNLYAANHFQGITAQQGAHIIIDGISMRGDAHVTLVNALFGGVLTIKSLRVGRGPLPLGQSVSAAGAAMGGQINMAGKLSIAGSGQPLVVTDINPVFAAIQNGRIHFFPGNSIHFENTANFGYMFVLEGGSVWSENLYGGNSAPVWTGAVSGSIGSKYSIARYAMLSVSAASIPGYGPPYSQNDGTGIVFP